MKRLISHMLAVHWVLICFAGSFPANAYGSASFTSIQADNVACRVKEEALAGRLKNFPRGRGRNETRAMDFAYFVRERDGSAHDYRGWAALQRSQPVLLKSIHDSLLELCSQLQDVIADTPELSAFLAQPSGWIPDYFKTTDTNDIVPTVYYSPRLHAIRIDLVRFSNVVLRMTRVAGGSSERFSEMMLNYALTRAQILRHEMGHVLAERQIIHWKNQEIQTLVEAERAEWLSRVDGDSTASEVLLSVEEDLNAEVFNASRFGYTSLSNAYGASFYKVHEIWFHNSLANAGYSDLIRFARDIVRWKKNGPVDLYQLVSDNLFSIEDRYCEPNDLLLKNLVGYFMRYWDAHVFDAQSAAYQQLMTIPARAA